MENWDEVRTAYQVARLGTVSGAAEVLGVHHATVIRHIDAIEARLGVKLFQRHARGYTPTEAGLDLLRVAQATDDQFSQLVGRLKGQGDEVSGELVVTSLSSMAPMLAPALTEFQQMHPDLVIRYLTGDRLFRLEYGEAHVALRAGAAPEQPDNVVQPFVGQRLALYASEEYVARHGMLKGQDDMVNHRFVASDNENTRAPFERWLRATIPAENIVFRCSDAVAGHKAIRAGAGIGFISLWEAASCPDLVMMMDPRDEWSGKIWLVTHVDLHRTNKVQSFVRFLKEHAKTWPQ
ncbi:Transcriptional regulator, LysR family [Tritonibacter mobilis]|uniref:LysR family transcriptional regulator n=1 Tax=Tritonibacter mobilis TaxID=379347 RepID=UPI000806D7EB|nr:LysR family transcriptional regulator [Tritonibacter mobilis]MBW3241610.1 LysR family transcriptional regulator [Epibacterium sp. DP7N7-1]MCZ4266796.1 LysR family transcriptional regulator [Rhodobacteraceae bacterium G21628-S1]MEE2810277.1 LysR family transcriptional regulator [Pseudomonadota bacterium]NKX75416.1 LysR family transcriptional regulator [Rhodobacteraceae bacterium R_SAG3]PXW84443.1 LysR family transcriptional regulator [Ruegeria sp. P4]